MSNLGKNLNSSEYNPLTKNELEEITKKLILAKSNNNISELKKIEEILIKKHIRMVVHIGKKYNLEYDDMLGIGLLALTQAIQRWRPEKGKLYLYAERYIKTALNRATDANRAIRIPEKVSYKAAKLQIRINEISQELGRDLTREEIEQITKGFSSFDDLPIVTESLDRKVNIDGNTTIGETIIDYNDPSEIVSNNLDIENVIIAINELSEIEQDVIKSRFGFDNYEKLTLQELGDKYGVTGEAMRRLENTIISKLRHPSLKSSFL